MSESSPYRYSRAGDGRWVCLPGEQYAAQWGLIYRVRSSATINWTYQRNVLFLEDYLRAVSPSVAPHIQDRIRTLAALRPGTTLEELIACVAPGTADDIYIVIITDVLFVDLRAAPLAEPGRVSVFNNEQAALGQDAPLPSSARRSLLNPETGTLISDLTQASPEDLATAYHRYTIIASDLREELSTQPELVTGRTKRRWVTKYRVAEKE